MNWREAFESSHRLQAFGSAETRFSLIALCE